MVFFAICITILLLYTACTYDYFEDQTNYIVYVPEVRDKTVDDCRVLIYNESGLLVGDKSVTASTNDPKLNLGLFTFRLPAGNYKVYCYTNIDGISFFGENTHETSAFSLPVHDTEENYLQPPDIFYDKLEHTIQSPVIQHADTASIKRYVGRITVRFKNIPFDLASLSNIELVAEGVASMQYLKHDTLTSHVMKGDVLKHTDDADSYSFSEGILEVDHRYFPSVENTCKTLNFTFIDLDGNAIAFIQVSVTDPDTNLPLRLYRGERIIIEVDRYLVSTIRLVGWDEDIKSGGSTGLW